MVSKCCRAGLVLVLGLFFHLTPGAAHAALPNGSIAVLVKSASAQEAAQTALPNTSRYLPANSRTGQATIFEKLRF